jgi:hypothetical protein
MPKPFTDLFEPKFTPTGPKMVPKPDRECPKCYEVGEIILDEPCSKTLKLIKKKCLKKATL